MIIMKLLWDVYFKLTSKFKLRNLRYQYDDILQYLKLAGVNVTDEKRFYNSKNSKKATVLLRHDVDRRLDTISLIRQIEKKNKVTSTLHIRAKGRTYDLNELKRMNLSGFDIALHLESSELDDIKRDKMALEKAVKRKIIGASIHGGYYSGKDITKEKILNNLKKAGFKYITYYNEKDQPVKENGMLLIPYVISDLEIVQRGYKRFMKRLENIIEKGACTSLNTHPEYF